MFCYNNKHQSKFKNDKTVKFLYLVFLKLKTKLCGANNFF